MQLTPDNVAELITAITPAGCFTDGNRIQQTTTLVSIDADADGVSVGSARLQWGEVPEETIKRLRDGIAWHRR